MSPLLALAAPAAIVWTAVLFQRGGLLFGCLAVLLTGICLGPPFFHQSIGPIPVSLDRLLWIVLIAFYLACRATGRVRRRPFVRSDWALAAFYLVAFVNVLAFDFRAGGGYPVAQLVFFHMIPLGMYWVARQATYSERTPLKILLSAAIFGTWLSITAVAETRGLDWAVYPQYILSPDFPEFLGRARGPLLNPSGSGMLQGLCLAAAVLLWPIAGRKSRLVLGGVYLLMLAGIYSTLTRSVWMGAGLGLLVIGALTLPRRLRWPVVLGCVLAAAILGVSQRENLISFKRDRDLTAQDVAESVKLRPILAVVAWEIFRHRPLTGCGLGHYMESQQQYLNERPFGLPLEKARPFIQHNIFLAYLAELGLIGLALYLIVLGLWIGDAWSLWRSTGTPPAIRQYGLFFLAFLANYFANGMFHDVTRIPMVNMVLYCLAGTLVALRQQASHQPAAATE